MQGVGPDLRADEVGPRGEGRFARLLQEIRVHEPGRVVGRVGRDRPKERGVVGHAFEFKVKSEK